MCLSRCPPPKHPSSASCDHPVGCEARRRDAGPRRGDEATVSLIFIILLSGSMIIRGTHLIRFQLANRVGSTANPECKWCPIKTPSSATANTHTDSTIYTPLQFRRNISGLNCVYVLFSPHPHYTYLSS